MLLHFVIELLNILLRVDWSVLEAGVNPPNGLSMISFLINDKHYLKVYTSSVVIPWRVYFYCFSFVGLYGEIKKTSLKITGIHVLLIIISYYSFSIAFHCYRKGNV